MMALIRPTQGVNFTPVPSTSLDTHEMGRVALTGDFDSISLYTYQQQTENAFSTNGTQSLITQLPNGDFATTASADGYIKAMCPFVMQDGKFAGVIVGGNFTSLGGVEAQGVAMYDSVTAKVTPLPGLTGSVNALLCDKDTNTVYVGGEFKGANSTNAVAWVGMSGWANLPFEGFNGPVNSIITGSNGNVVFGGSFTGLGNSTTTTPNQKDQQIINISTANITAVGTSTTAGFNNATNIVCKTNGQDGSGNTWLLEDNTPGSWTAAMNFGYEPSLLRIWNTHQDGRGAKIFRFTAIPLNGIMNFTYTDPDTGEEGLYCDARCPLSSNKSVPYQDFRFWNTVGMSSFRIDISEWYGAGGGLDGVELFQNGNPQSTALTFLPSLANIDRHLCLRCQQFERAYMREHPIRLELHGHRSVDGLAISSEQFGVFKCNPQWVKSECKWSFSGIRAGCQTESQLYGHHFHARLSARQQLRRSRYSQCDWELCCQ